MCPTGGRQNTIRARELAQSKSEIILHDRRNSQRRNAQRDIAPGRLRFAYQLRIDSHETLQSHQQAHHCVKRPDCENAMEGPNIWRKDGKFVHRNCEQCRSEFWAKMPWAAFVRRLAECFPHTTEARHVPHSINEAERRKYERDQSWHGTSRPTSSGLRQHDAGRAVAFLRRSSSEPWEGALLRWVPSTFRQVLGSTETGNQGHPKKANAPPPKPQTVALTLAKTPPSAVYRSNRDRAGTLRPRCELILPRATEPLLR